MCPEDWPLASGIGLALPLVALTGFATEFPPCAANGTWVQCLNPPISSRAPLITQTQPGVAMTHDIVQTSAADTLPPFDAATFWAQFRHDNVAIKSVRLHFVKGGSGAPILLLPGWPQSWYAWRYVMPLLAARGRLVIALDPRGG